MFIQIRVISDTFRIRNFLKYLTLQMEEEVLKIHCFLKYYFLLKKSILYLIKGSIQWKDTIMNTKHLLMDYQNI